MKKETIFIFQKEIWENFCKIKKIEKNHTSILKNLIIYISSIPALGSIISKIFLPWEFIKDDKLFELINSFLLEKKIDLGIILELDNFLFNDDINYSNFQKDSLDKLFKNKIKNIYVSYNFGKRKNNTSPKHNNYILSSQYMWNNIGLLNFICNKNNINLYLNLDIHIDNSSVENIYIHYRQIIWDGIDIFKKMDLEFSKLNIVMQPIYHTNKKEKQDENTTASITYRYITECLSKNSPQIILMPNDRMDFVYFRGLVEKIRRYDKESKIQFGFDINLLKLFYDNWKCYDDNVLTAQQKLYGELEKFNL
jgi:hypothetical protein